jgi:hypothetical protein
MEYTGMSYIIANDDWINAKERGVEHLMDELPNDSFLYVLCAKMLIFDRRF